MGGTLLLFVDIVAMSELVTEDDTDYCQYLLYLGRKIDSLPKSYHNLYRDSIESVMG